MLHVLRTLILALLLSTFTLLTAAQPAQAQTSPWGGNCIVKQSDGGDVATLQGLECLVANVFTVFITIIGLAAFVMFIVASFRILVSGGNTKGMETGRNTMTFAVIGIVVALSAYIILNLISAFTGVESIRIFKIPNWNDSYGPIPSP